MSTTTLRAAELPRCLELDEGRDGAAHATNDASDGDLNGQEDVDERVEPERVANGEERLDTREDMGLDVNLDNQEDSEAELDNSLAVGQGGG